MQNIFLRAAARQHVLTGRPCPFITSYLAYFIIYCEGSLDFSRSVTFYESLKFVTLALLLLRITVFFLLGWKFVSESSCS